MSLPGARNSNSSLQKHLNTEVPRPIKFSILNSQFSILNFQFSIFNSQFSILNFQFSIFNSQFSIFNSQFSILNFQFSIFNSQFSIFNSQFSILNFIVGVDGTTSGRDVPALRERFKLASGMSVQETEKPEWNGLSEAKLQIVFNDVAVGGFS